MAAGLRPWPRPEEPPAPAPPPHDVVERHIEERIREIDAVALRALLEELDHDVTKVRYWANATRAPQPALFDSIAFDHPGVAPAGPRRMLGAPAPAPSHLRMVDLLRQVRLGSRGEVSITVTVNLGLLSCRSPLPTYFDELLRDPDYQGPLMAVIDILDDGLIQNRLESFRPERVASYLEDWGATKRDWLRLTSVPTPCTLHWMFQQIFPELEVSVRRAPRSRAMPAPSVRIGDPRSRVGTAAFGGEAQVTAYGLEVTLLTDDAACDTGTPWPVEVRARTEEQAFPILGEARVDLTVVLLSRSRPPELQVDDPTYLGTSPLGDDAGDAPAAGLRGVWGGSRAPPSGLGPPWRVVIWSGAVPDPQER